MYNFIRKKLNSRKVSNETVCDQIDYNIKEKKYRNIPVYTDVEIEQAIVENSDDVKYNSVGMQLLYGYVSLKANWVIGKNSQGLIVKTNELLIFESEDNKQSKRKELVNKTQSQGLKGSDLKNEIFCKLTYDLKKDDIFSIHTKLKKEYVENEIAIDQEPYVGLHFTKLDTINLIMDIFPTCYGNKIILIQLLDEEIYYEYIKDYFIGKKFYVSKIMYLYDVDTWIYLNKLTSSISKHNDEIIKLLIYLNDSFEEDDYSQSINFLRSIE